MKTIRFLSELKLEDFGRAGGKGARLAETKKIKLPVPDGFVVLMSAFNQFMEKNGISKRLEEVLTSVDYTDSYSLREISDDLTRRMMEGELPELLTEGIMVSFDKLQTEFVAVRGSGPIQTHEDVAWAGQLENFLNIRKENLLETLKKCWISMVTPRALAYRFEHHLQEQKPSMAVVIQKMIQSEVSGIAFSVHPVNNTSNQMLIEAAFGLGNAVVSGEVNPDSYIVEKGNFAIIDKSICMQEKELVYIEGKNEWRKLDDERKGLQKLEDRHIRQLAEMVVRIEDHFEIPVDVEWAFQNGKLFILQTRPITSLVENHLITS
jgi:pyruvate,water dikinase